MGEGRVNDYRDLIVWRKAMDLVEKVYELSAAFPSDERFGLTAQMRRSAVSIPSNIAEGSGRRTRRDYVHFLDVARGSANELHSQLLLAVRLQSADEGRITPVGKLNTEIQRMIKGLITSLERCGRSDVRGKSIAPSDLGPRTSDLKEPGRGPAT